jgi:uncharacterized protein (DUF1800 family)
VADEPPPTLVDRLASRFLDTDGDLKELARALVAAPEAWMPEQRLNRDQDGGCGLTASFVLGSLAV